jgi:hypothetical protein
MKYCAKIPLLCISTMLQFGGGRLHQTRMLVGALGVKVKKDSLKDVPRTSNIKSKRCGGSSVKREATQILSAAPGVISPCMRMSFVDR